MNGRACAIEGCSNDPGGGPMCPTHQAMVPPTFQGELKYLRDRIAYVERLAVTAVRNKTGNTP